MKRTDYFKALGVALAIMVLNVLVVILAVTVYSYLINSGQSSEFYQESAKRIAPWCTRTVGLGFFFAAGYFLTRRSPDRKGILFALVLCLFYSVIDAATVGFKGIVDLEFLLSMLANLLASVFGAHIAARSNKRAETT